MYIINSDVFEKLPDEAKSVIEAEGKAVSDEDKISAIEKLAEVENDENNMDDDMSEVKFGDEDEYSTRMDSEGRMEDMPESKKNSIKSFDDAHQRGYDLVGALAEKGLPKKKDKVEAIPENKKAMEEKKPTY
jgi:hypothetical protein